MADVTGNRTSDTSKQNNIPIPPPTNQKTVARGWKEWFFQLFSEGVTRELIAFWLLALLTGVLCSAYHMMSETSGTPAKYKFEDIKEFLQLVLTPLITLVSAATGFYFGSQSGKDSSTPSTAAPATPPADGTP